MTIRNIPPEYLTFRQEDDFGFSAIDESALTTTVNPDTLETEVIRDTLNTSVEGVSRLEAKMDTILSLYNEGRLGLDAERQEVQSKLVQLEQLIMPLLVNLMKNPEKEYIFWPNRTDKLQEQIDRVLQITRGTD